MYLFSAGTWTEWALLPETASSLYCYPGSKTLDDWMQMGRMCQKGEFQECSPPMAVKKMPEFYSKECDGHISTKNFKNIALLSSSIKPTTQSI